MGEFTATGATFSVAAELRERLRDARDPRLAGVMTDLVAGIERLTAARRVSRDEFARVIRFLTDVGDACDGNRQEWVLLSDALGVSTMIEDQNAVRPAGATPNTIAGPFYRAGVPLMADGADIALARAGEPLSVSLTVVDGAGTPVAGAQVEVWHANGRGLYENQDPENQPELNLRGRFLTDARGRVTFRTERPAGYALPADGPVGRLMAEVGLPTRRPAHLHFRVEADGFDDLVTHVFDADDPRIGQDALFAVRPELVARFVPLDGKGGRGHRLDCTFVLAALPQDIERPPEDGPRI